MQQDDSRSIDGVRHALHPETVINAAYECAKERFRGVFALLLTPFREDGSIDWTGYETYVDWQLSHRPHGLFAVCGSSEMQFLDRRERIELARRAVKRAGGTPVIATANVEPDPAGHAEELEIMAETGISAAVLITPRGSGGDSAYLEDYFRTMAERSPVPVILYECPMDEPYRVPPEVYGKLARSGRILGIKDTTSTMNGIRAKIDADPSSLVYQANMPLALDALLAGAGGIMAIANASAVRHVLRLWELMPEYENAVLYHRKLIYLDAIIKMGHTASSKYLVSEQGVPIGHRTRTGSAISEPVAKALKEWLANMSEDADRQQQQPGRS